MCPSKNEYKYQFVLNCWSSNMNYQLTNVNLIKKKQNIDNHAKWQISSAFHERMKRAPGYRDRIYLSMAPRPWLPNTSNSTLSLSTASHITTLGSPTSVIVSAKISSKENTKLICQSCIRTITLDNLHFSCSIFRQP